MDGPGRLAPTTQLQAPRKVERSPKWGSPGQAEGQLAEPSWVAVDAADNVYVTGAMSTHVQKFSNTGTFLNIWGDSGSGDCCFGSTAQGLAADGSGSVYVADPGNARIQKFGPSTP